MQTLQEPAVAAFSKLAVWVVGFLIMYVVYYLGYFVYSITLHPLASYPGPWLWMFTQIPYSYYYAKGTMVFKIAELHRKYGPIVRIRPNEISYIRADAWKDIYGGRAGLPKNDAFAAATPATAGLFFTTNKEDHARMRKTLNPGFSDKALREQEPRMMQYVDLLIQRLREKSDDGPLDVCSWYNFTTFDIIGELFYSTSFNCLESSMYNDWIKAIFISLKYAALFRELQRYALLRKILPFLVPRDMKQQRDKHRGYALEKLDQRLARKDAPPDFLSHVQASLNTPDGFSLAEIQSTVVGFMIAGSETSATTLTVATFLLLKNQSCLKKLTKEIRTTFINESEITINSVNDLTYQLAVIEEALRLWPAGAGTGPRTTLASGQDTTICGKCVPPGTIVSIPHWAAFHSPLNFRDPNDFVPERWLGDPRYEGDNLAVCQPFSYGPRNCLGRGLAYAEIRIILAKVLWHFDLELYKESDNWLDDKRLWFIWQRGPLMVKLTPVARN